MPIRQSAAAFGNLIDDFTELGILLLEELVQVVELRSGDVPMVVSCFGVEQILDGQQGVQDLDDTATVCSSESRYFFIINFSFLSDFRRFGDRGAMGSLLALRSRPRVHDGGSLAGKLSAKVESIISSEFVDFVCFSLP